MKIEKKFEGNFYFFYGFDRSNFRIDGLHRNVWMDMWRGKLLVYGIRTVNNCAEIFFLKVYQKLLRENVVASFVGLTVAQLSLKAFFH